MTDLNKEEVYEKLIKFCHSRLLKDEEAMQYPTSQRKLTDEVIKQFQIGLFPKDLRELFDLFDPKTLRDLEIILHASKSKYQIFDLIMPIKDVYGKCVAIAGRTRLSDEKRKEMGGLPKYYNSPYKKSNHLFGLHLAKQSIIKSGVAYVVEGYYDVMTPHQHGLTNTVAICGSSMNTRQIILLSRYTDNIVLLFDNEPKAQKLAQQVVRKNQEKGVEIVAKTPFPINIKDIDEYLHHYSVEELRERLKSGGEFDDVTPSWD